MPEGKGSAFGTPPLVLTVNSRGESVFESTVSGGVIRKPLRHASHRGNRVDVHIPVVLGSERDGRSIRGEEWRRFRSRGAGKPRRISAGSGHAPQVSGILENDLRLAERRMAHQERIGPGIKRVGSALRNEGNEREEKHHF